MHLTTMQLQLVMRQKRILGQRLLLVTMRALRQVEPLRLVVMPPQLGRLLLRWVLIVMQANIQLLLLVN